MCLQVCETHSPGVKMMLVGCWFSVLLSSLHNPFKQVSVNLELGWQPASLGSPVSAPHSTGVAVVCWLFKWILGI